MNQRFVQILREKFEQGLQAKTGWGKNEVLSLFERCLTDAMSQLYDEASNPWDKGGES
jgi:hypothetical protein